MARKDFYGLDKVTVDDLKAKWKKHIKGNSDWKNFDSFLYWAAENGYQVGMILRRHYNTEPWGSDNAYLTAKKNSHKEEKPVHETPEEASFCAGCTKVCHLNRKGCDDWKNWFVRNWNKNIHQKKPKEPRQFFKYEHPDLIREGITDG